MTKVVLFASGSFNPPTNMHFRMFELAKNFLEKRELFEIIGGVMSPVHSAYKKQDMIDSKHRLEMLRLGAQNSNWIKISDWECKQLQWTRTRELLTYHQKNLDDRNYALDWVPDCLKITDDKAQILYLCGADLLESFSVPNLWSSEDILYILENFGLAVVTRHGSNPNQYIYESDLLAMYLNKIHVVYNWFSDDISSTKIRRAIRRKESIKYLIPDSIINYISDNKLYL